MNKYKVTHVIRLDEANELPPLSGAENHLLFLLPSLVELGQDVELLVVLRGQGKSLVDVFDKLRQSGVKVTTLPLAMKPTWQSLGVLPVQRVIELSDLLRKRKDRIIHLHLDYFGAPVAAWLAGCSKVVMSIHNDENWLSKFWMRLWLRLIDVVIKRYIAISDRVKSYYSSVAGVDPGKIQRIYYGVQYNTVQPTATVRKRFCIPGDKFVFGFVGRLTYQKNVGLLIDAASNIPESHCVIVGDGELGDNLQKQASNLGNVQFLGQQPKGYELMPGFDLFCLPSRFEGLGLVLIEAMLQGVPIAASRAGAIPEVVRNGEYGLLFDSGDLEGLVNSIRYAMNNKSAISEMAIRAKQYASETFIIQEMAMETIRVYAAISQEYE